MPSPGARTRSKPTLLGACRSTTHERAREPDDHPASRSDEPPAGRNVRYGSNRVTSGQPSSLGLAGRAPARRCRRGTAGRWRRARARGRPPTRAGSGRRRRRRRGRRRRARRRGRARPARRRAGRATRSPRLAARRPRPVPRPGAARRYAPEARGPAAGQLLADEGARLLERVGGLGQEGPEDLEDVRVRGVELEPGVDAGRLRALDQPARLLQHEVAGRGLHEQRWEAGEVGEDRAGQRVVGRVAREVGADRELEAAVSSGSGIEVFTRSTPGDSSTAPAGSGSSSARSISSSEQTSPPPTESPASTMRSAPRAARPASGRR